jgi:hypothetical protein
MNVMLSSPVIGGGGGKSDFFDFLGVAMATSIV